MKTNRADLFAQVERRFRGGFAFNILGSEDLVVLTAPDGSVLTIKPQHTVLGGSELHLHLTVAGEEGPGC